METASLRFPEATSENPTEVVHLSEHWRKSLRGNGLIVRNGIVDAGVQDDFYDEHGFTSSGRRFGDGIVDRFGLYFARGHFLHEISKTIEPGAHVIELGCGGGSRHLASRYDMLGVELSSQAVQHAARVYQSVIKASVVSLPLTDGSSDGIISSFLLEHLGDDIVEASLAEMARVLRPGAMMLHYFDLRSSGTFFAWAERQNWYQAKFIVEKGHFGIRSLDVWEKLFSKAGFEVERTRLSCKSWVQDTSIWAVLNDPRVPAMARIFARGIGAFRSWTNPIGDLGVIAINDVVDRWLPDEWASKGIVVLRKK
jgi:ubiquinone/menaquinone biosynthesis C-methylase UbiE